MTPADQQKRRDPSRKKMICVKCGEPFYPQMMYQRRQKVDTCLLCLIRHDGLWASKLDLQDD